LERFRSSAVAKSSSANGISVLASDRIQLDPKAIARIRDGTGNHHFAIRAKADLKGDRRRNLRLPEED